MIYPYDNLKDFTLRALIERSNLLYSQQDAFAKVGQDPLNYSEVFSKIKSTINLLQDNGISRGDKVLLLSENMPNWAIAYFSVTYFGGVIVPVLPDFHTSDVHQIIRHSEAKAVFVSSKHQSTIEECEDSSAKIVINLDKLNIIEDLCVEDYLLKIKQKTKKLKQKILHKEQIPQEDDLAAIIYTSGTTGHSKGVMLSHKNLVTNALSSHSKVKITHEDRFLSILPLAHTYECTAGMLIPVLHGASIYYIDKPPPPSILLKAFKLVKPTMMMSVPLIIEKIYKNKILAKFTSSFIMRNLYKVPYLRKQLNKIAGKKLIETFGGELKFFGIGGAGIAPYLEEFLIEAEFPFVVGYGLTETSPLLAGSVLGETIKFKSTGTAMTGVELKIKDKNPETGEGEIIAKSPSIMLGYYKDKEKTAEVMEDGWFLTGDLGHIDKDGFLFISGRSKNVIIGSGGENIYPEQIESIINQNKVVLDSLVMQQDGKLIARIHLDYELIAKMFKAENSPDAKVKKDITNYLEKMRQEVNSKVSSFSKMIKFIEQIEPFIKTPTKKIKRYLYTD